MKIKITGRDASNLRVTPEPGPGNRSQIELEVPQVVDDVGASRTTIEEFNQVRLICYYTKEEDGFHFYPKKPEGPHETLTIEVRLHPNFLGADGVLGPLTIFEDSSGELLNLEGVRRCSMMATHMKGGVTARNGIGDWTKKMTLSEGEELI